MSRPLVTAYAASLARVGSWIIVLGLVFRTSGDAGSTNLGLLALARSSVGLLGYASLGILPVLVRLLARAGKDEAAAGRVYTTSAALVGTATAVCSLLLIGYVAIARHVPSMPLSAPTASAVFVGVGIATLVRSASDVFGSVVLAANRIVADNVCQIAAEISFVLATVLLTPLLKNPPVSAAFGFLTSAAVLMASRGGLASFTRPMRMATFDRQFVWPILLLCGAVLAGQMADWLYAPLNQLLIGWRLGKETVSAYAVAIQIDSGLLLLVGGLAAVLLPTAAIAFHEGRVEELRRRFILGWSASLMLLLAASIFIFLLAAPLLQAWFNDPMQDTRDILPWVLIHTTIGGTAGVGRAVLLAIGRVKAYTISAIIGGVANGAMAYVLLTFTHLGLRGVVLATIVTVAVRCGLWMPWYTLRCLRQPTPSPI